MTPPAMGNERETNASLTSPQTLTKRERLPDKPKERYKIKKS